VGAGFDDSKLGLVEGQELAQLSPMLGGWYLSNQADAVARYPQRLSIALVAVKNLRAS
jgi:hypothetical protein